MTLGKKGSTRPAFINRAFRSLISILLLSAFILGISFFVREISTLDTDKLVALSSPVLKKLGLSEDMVGEVAGAFASRVLSTSISASKPVAGTQVVESDIEEPAVGGGASSVRKEQVLKVAIMSDSEDDNATLKRALFEAANVGAEAVFHLGDITLFGTMESLEEAKKILAESNLPYYVLPGDHDLYKSVGPQNFEQVFGDSSEVVTLNGIKFVLLNNSANYTLIEDNRVSWFELQIADANFIMFSQPIYHPSPSVISPVMGMVNGEKDEDVYLQRGELLSLVQNSSAKALFAGDHHRSSQYADLANNSFIHHVIGAINESRKIQSSRFSVLTIYNTGEYEVSEVLLD